jgi:hypothetical protein
LTQRVIARPAQAAGEETPVPGAVSAPLRRAQEALAAARLRVTHGRSGAAVASLRSLRVNLVNAHDAGIAVLTRHVSDDGEDPPGPEAVFAIFALEHRVTVRLAVLFDGLRDATVARALRSTLRLTHARRDVMLAAVIRRPDGDFADGMADELPSYDVELAAITAALDHDQLFGTARLGLTSALERVRATQATATRAYGGEE